MTETLIDGVVRHARQVEIDTLDESTLAAARNLLLDSLGVGTAGGTTTESAMALQTALGWGTGDEARPWGTGAALPAAAAAFVNAHQMHCLEFDAIHEPAVVHPMTVVLPVLAAWVQREKARGRTVSGADLVRGIVVGVDVAGGLGDVTTTPLQFFRPGTAGALGAAAALATAARADHDLGVAALGVAFGGISGTMQAHTEGAQLLALQVGFNARATLSAWDLAKTGFRGPRQILEGRFGYFALIEAGGRPEALVERLGTQWEVERTSIKPFPSGRASHGAIDGALELQRRHGFRLEDVESIEVAVPPMVERLVGRLPDVGMSLGAARLCLRLLIPVALRQGTVDLTSYARSVLDDPEMIAAAGRVSVTADGNSDPNAFDPQTVKVTLRDGTRCSITKDQSLGSPSQPLSRESLERKFRANLDIAGCGAAADRVINLVDGIAELDDASELLELL